MRSTYIQEEKESSHMNVSLIHPILTLNPPIGLWMNSSQNLDCCMSLESLKVVPASNRVKEVSYGIRTISGLFVGWMRSMLVCNNLLSLSLLHTVPTEERHRLKFEEVSKHLIGWLIDLMSYFMVPFRFSKNKIWWCCYTVVSWLSLSPCQRIIRKCMQIN